MIAFRAGHRRSRGEENDLRSLSPGVPVLLHACGHDIHTAVLLTFARFSQPNRELGPWNCEADLAGEPKKSSREAPKALRERKARYEGMSI